ncbi:MAG: hypothetical protein WC370_02930 [Dehalococcoidales bacterium]
MGEKRNCLLLQEQVLATLMRIENNIRRHRIELKEIRRYLSKGREISIDKFEVRRAKESIEWHSSRIKEYQLLLITFRSIVDGLAFTYLDKWDIKQFALKECSGFISEKSGLKFELKILHLAFSLNNVALLNDLTNCLRHGDITILAKGRRLFVEAKSGRRKDARAQRQESKLKDIMLYLSSGKSNKFHAIGDQEGEFIRVPIHGPEINHMDDLNLMLVSARSSPDQYSMVEVEPGLHYLATYAAKPRALSTLSDRPPGSLIISFVNELKYNGMGYYPFSLSIYDPKDWYDFYSGKLMLVIAVETKVIEDKLSSHGISVNITGDWGTYPITLINNDKNEDPTKSLVGGHFFGRLFYEFLSLDWMLEEWVYRRDHEID